MNAFMNVFFLSLVVALVHGSQVQITPVQKVVALLEGMLEKGKKEKHDEEVQFTIFQKFCEETLGIRMVRIDEATVAIEHLTVNIRSERVKAGVMGHEMNRLDRDISAWTGDINAAKKVRDIEKADYDALHEDYSDSIDALMRAIATLRKESHDRKQQSGLMQIMTMAEIMPARSKKVVDAFVQHAESSMEALNSNAPSANAYEFQSAGVVEMLDKLLGKFMDERRAIEKEEMNSNYAYTRLVKDLNLQIEEAEKRRAGKAASKAKQLALKAENKGERVDENGLKISDTKYKKDLEATCKIKMLAFSSRQKLRADEITAVEQAIKIIGSDAVSANAVKHLPTLVQKKGSSFAQLRSGSKSWNPTATYLQEQAIKYNSRVLAAIAEHAAVDPFIKVRKMIKALLSRLMEQASEEAEHKGWCDEEMTTNSQTRNDKTAAVEILHAEIDQLQASIAKHAEDITASKVAVAEIDAAMAEQMSIRSAEKAKNQETISDTRAAQDAVEQALAVLRDFYVKASEATAFVQKSAAPEIFDSSYNGMEGKGEEVMGMLEVIQTDFARLESATKAAEATGQREFEEFMLDSKTDKSAKATNLEHKASKKEDDSHTLTTKKADLERTQSELDAAFVYFDKLKPSCVDAGDQYAERAAMRQEEIESLKEALGKLEGNDI